MKNISLKQRGKTRAQAMVEFALALPVLLLLIYGIIEVGRLIFIFSSAANASRQAARYGSGSGEINDLAFYQDCEGIRKVASQSAFITTFDKINITYDRGLNPDGTQIPIAGIDPDPSVDSCPVESGIIRNGDRIIVQVSSTYEPILSLLPFDPMKIVSASARSFLISIPVIGSALPTGFAAESSTPSLAPTVNTATLLPTIVRTPTFTHLPPLNTPSTRLPPTITQPPTVTFTPSSTPLASSTPSATPTAISCSGLTGVSHGRLVFKDDVMRMSINNQTGYTLVVAQIYLEWNHDTGHGSGDDPGLRLRQVRLAEDVWNGDIQAPSAYIVAFYPSIPPGESTIYFTFHQDYEQIDGTERIIVYIGTPGCVNYPVDSRN